MLLNLQNKHICAQGLRRKRLPITKRQRNQITIAGQSCINFSGNDYLGLASNNEVCDALHFGINKYGWGSAASPLVSGYYDMQQELETRFALWLNRPKALYVNSGYLANLAVINTLATCDTTVISDKYCHASLLDGIKLSRAKHLRFAHNDMLALQQRLIRLDKNPNYIVTEGVFSMTGMPCPLDTIVKLNKQYQASLIIDDAHGIGILGESGKGIIEYYQQATQNIYCLITSLSKAFGTMGAIISGDEDLIDSLLQHSSSYRYATALPPALALATLKALDIVENESWRRQKLTFLISCFINEAKVRNLPLLADDITPIKALQVGNNFLVLEFQQQLLNAGFFVGCIRPPSVPQGSARLRITINCLHTTDDILKLVNALVKLYECNKTKNKAKF